MSRNASVIDLFAQNPIGCRPRAIPLGYAPMGRKVGWIGLSRIGAVPIATALFGIFLMYPLQHGSTCPTGYEV